MNWWNAIHFSATRFNLIFTSTFNLPAISLCSISISDVTGGGTDVCKFILGIIIQSSQKIHPPEHAPTYTTFYSTNYTHQVLHFSTSIIIQYVQ